MIESNAAIYATAKPLEKRKRITMFRVIFLADIATALEENCLQIGPTVPNQTTSPYTVDVWFLVRQRNEQHKFICRGKQKTPAPESAAGVAARLDGG